MSYDAPPPDIFDPTGWAPAVEPGPNPAPDPAVVTNVVYTTPADPVVAGKTPRQRAKRTVAQALIVLVGVLPVAVLAANGFAAQNNLDWEVPVEVMIFGAIGAGLVPVVSALQNWWDARHGES